MQVEIYSDVACPWCYIGKKRFEKALAAFPGRDQVQVRFRSFQLDPTLPTDPAQAQDANSYYTQKFGPNFKEMQARVVDLAGKEGIDYQTEKTQLINTLAAHRLIWLAEQTGGAELQAKVADALFQAYFTEGRNVADPETLLAIGTQAGLDAERVRSFLASDEGREEVQAQIARAHQMGINSVPTFVFDGRWGVPGAQEVETFLQVFHEVANQAAGGGHVHGPGCSHDH
jgi:predicted DsbA family dithiol-disulfide isomerase